jgi:hypothetical protein
MVFEVVVSYYQENAFPEYFQSIASNLTSLDLMRDNAEDYASGYLFCLAAIIPLCTSLQILSIHHGAPTDMNTITKPHPALIQIGFTAILSKTR